ADVMSPSGTCDAADLRPAHRWGGERAATGVAAAHGEDDVGGLDLVAWLTGVPLPCQKQPTMEGNREHSRDVRVTAELPPRNWGTWEYNLIRMRSNLKTLRPNGQAPRQPVIPGDTDRDDQ